MALASCCVCVSIRFSSERSPDLAAHTAERHDITSTDAQRGVREGLVFSVFDGLYGMFQKDLGRFIGVWTRRSLSAVSLGRC